MKHGWTLILALAAGCAQEATDPEIALFNGVDLSGWHGDTTHWSVEDGSLVGRTTEPLARTGYLFTDLEADDFELRFEYRIAGGNSGVQYRSEELAGGDVAGYQADIEDGPNYTGILYESNGRAILAPRGARLWVGPDGERREGEPLGDGAALQGAVRAGEWNEYRVVAVGPRLVHEINGVRMVDVWDEEAAARRGSGRFAVQLHQGPPMEVRYRGMVLRRIARAEEAGIEPFPRIAAPPPVVRRAEWVWSSAAAEPGERRWFLHRFELDSPARVAGGEVASDNAFRMHLDGEPLAAGEDWQRPSAVPAGRELAAGLHWLAVEAWNLDGPAALAAVVELEGADGARRTLVTGEGWSATAAEPSGWPAMGGDPLGAAPWAAVHSFGPVGAHSGPWGQTLAPRVATPVESFVLPDGFRAELVHSARAAEGSWASMTFGPEGELYVSPERGPLLRFRFPQGHDAPPQVEALDTPVGSAQGLLFAHGALYANMAGGESGTGGLHRLRDGDGDGVFEQHDHLARYGPPSEHGAHGVVLGPDGMLYVVNGNATSLPEGVAADSPHRHWREDVLLPRIWDPRGHAVGYRAPGAVVLRTDADATRWEIVAGGMRNPYDLAFDANGELFTYDADMEWDIGAPWYRPPRVVHLVPGAEFGWRSGSAKWAPAFPDSLPPVHETGPSSPVGVVIERDSGFPAAWRDLLYLGDWAYGRILAVRLRPDGASFAGEEVEFLRGKPLNITDLEFGPDGALWFVTGGRGTQSGLYRVVWEGAAPPLRAAPPLDPAVLRRRALERADAPQEALLAALGDSDSWIRWAARGELERRPAAAWRDAALAADDELARAEALLALVRVDPAAAPELRRRVLGWDLAAAPAEVRWLVLRAAMLLRTRDAALGEAAVERVAADPELAARFAPLLPSGDAAFDRELARLLVAVEAPGLAPRLLELLEAARFQEEQIHYAMMLRLTTTGWTPELRRRAFTWMREARGMPGGLSLSGFLGAIETEALGRVPAGEVEALLAELPPAATQAYVPPAEPRPFVRAWTLTEALDALEADGRAADPARGAQLFRELGCVQCHRSGGDGGSLGPDLSAVGNRFGRRDLLEAVIDPQKSVSDQFPLVPMPPGLLDTVDAAGIRDLVGYLEGGPPR